MNKSREIQRQLQFVNESFNHTSSKQKNAMSRIKGDFYVPKEPDFQIKQVPEVENTLNNQQLNSQSVMEYRQSMKKQVQIWNHLADPQQKTLRVIVDDYYNQSISTITSNYLQNMKQLIVDSQDKVRMKRKELITLSTLAIRKEWEGLKVQLINAVHTWCKRCQEQEISHYLTKGELLSDGPLAQLASRLSTKRQQIETYSSRVVDLHKNNNILRQEQLTKNMQLTKTFLKQIWDKQFQFQVEELNKNVKSIVDQINPVHYKSNDGVIMRDMLHRAIDQVLQPVPIFSSFFQEIIKKGSSDTPKRGGIMRKNKSPQSQKQTVKEEHTPQTGKDVIIESFVNQTMKQIQKLKVERDIEWKMLTKRLNS